MDSEGNMTHKSQLTHEFGHVLDRFAGQKLLSMNTGLSQNEQFLNIFKLENDKLTDYAKKNSSEFWAEAFRLM
ncbi:anthrax toxin lethal factor-related metalloendopeptidase, partial [Bacillus cereus]|uniref:anthrax toxin lethal factor-related metalloendopeptidase n=1 Tax=Bacillus cereus TaxID=1396 RepID=UPI003C2CC81C